MGALPCLCCNLLKAFRTTDQAIGIAAMKKLRTIFLVAAIVITSLTLVSCSSSEDAVDGEDAASKVAAEDGAEDDVGGDEGSSEESDEVASDESSDEATEESASESKQSSDVATKSDTSGEENEVMADLGDDDLDKLDEDKPEASQSVAENENTPPPPAIEGTESAASDSTPPPSEPASTADLGTPGESATSMAAISEPPAAPVATLKKIRDAPYEQGGLLLNTVYVARKGDNIKSVSMRVLGKNDRKTLLKANPYLSRGVRVGDKIYYNSPNRPQDANQMLTYYEDNGLPAQSYIAKEGDNIRELGTQLLGHKDSWKELWATNKNLESKGELAVGTELRYWPTAEVPEQPAMPVVAQNEMPPPPPPAEMPPPPPPTDPNLAMNAAPPPPPPAEMPPPPPPVEPAVAAGTANLPPPPPPEGEPPVDPSLTAPEGTESASMLGMDMSHDNMMLLLVGGVLIIGGGLVLAIVRKSRSRKMVDGQTQL